MATWPYSTARWQRLRKLKLHAEPLCHPCSLRGRAVPANTVDHVKAIADGGEPYPDLNGLMSMCPACHSDKTNATDRPDRTGFGRRFKGCDTSGNPVDPHDPWHGGASKDGKGGQERPSASSQTDIVSENGSQGPFPWD